MSYQPYPKWLYSAEHGARLVQDRDEHAALTSEDGWFTTPDLKQEGPREEWTTGPTAPSPYVPQLYPKMIYGSASIQRSVFSQAELDALGPDWSGDPAQQQFPKIAFGTSLVERVIASADDLRVLPGLWFSDPERTIQVWPPVGDGKKFKGRKVKSDVTEETPLELDS